MSVQRAVQRLCLALLFAGALAASPAEAADRWVCPAGDATCGGTPAYSTIQSAVNAAVCGDTLHLAVQTWSLSSRVTLTNTADCGANWITIRSRGSDTLFPAAGHRLVLTDREDGQTSVNGVAWAGNTSRSNLATLKSGNDSRLFEALNGVRGYRFMFLRFEENDGGFGNILSFGQTTGQEFVSQEPRKMLIDRVVFEIDPIKGQRIGILMNGTDISVVNSSFVNFVTVGQDGQCLGGTNGSGPILIENNYLECATENFLFGGDDPHERTFVSTGSGSTESQIVYNEATFRTGHTENAHVFGNAASLVGESIACQVSADTSVARQFSTVTAINTTTNTITISQAFTTPPVSGVDCRWGVNFDGVTIRRNHLTKNLRWRNAILSAPTGVTAVGSTASGTIPAPGRFYRVTARNHDSYQGADITSAPSAEVQCSLDAAGRCTISWNAVSGATLYRVYYGSQGGQANYHTVTGATTFTDTGAAGTAGTPPTSGSVYQVKNLGELKQGINVLIEDNIFEYCWTAPAGSCYALWIKVVNQLGAGEFQQTRDVTIRYNVLRHVAGGFTFSSQEEYTAGIEGRPDKMSDIVVENNLVYDSGPGWTSGAMTGAFFAYTGPRDFVYQKNTVIHRTHSAVRFGSTATPWPGANSFACNLLVHNTNGMESDGFTNGTPSIDAHIGSANFTNNVITDSGYTYPATTIEPSGAAFTAAFVEYLGSDIGDYALVAGHAWRTGCSGGLIGADIATLQTRVAGVLEGTPSNAPFVVTTQLPGATRTVAYSHQLEAGGGNGSAKTWALAPGSAALPTGMTLSSGGLLSATAGGFTAAAATYTFTVRVSDNALSGDRTLQLVVSATAPTITITTTSPLPNGALNVAYSQILAATGGNGNFSWTRTGLLPAGLQLSTAGVLSGTPTQNGPFTFTATVTDTAGQSASRQFNLLISNILPNEPGDDSGRNDTWNGQQIYSFRNCGGLQALIDDPETPSRSKPQPRDICFDESTGRLTRVVETTPTLVLEPYAIQSEVPWKTVPKTATQDVSNSTALVDDSDLQIELSADTKYAIRCHLFLGMSAAGDFKYRFEFSGTASYVSWHKRGVVAGGDQYVGVLTQETLSTGDSAFSTSTTGAGWLESFATVHVSGTAGTFKVRFAQSTADALAPASIKAGSWCDYMVVQ